MGGESRYQTNNPSKQIIIPTFPGRPRSRDFCIDSKKICKDLHNSYLDSPELQLVSGKKDSTNKLASWFVTGFTDAEGCFGIYIYKNTKYKTN